MEDVADDIVADGKPGKMEWAFESLRDTMKCVKDHNKYNSIKSVAAAAASAAASSSVFLSTYSQMTHLREKLYEQIQQFGKKPPPPHPPNQKQKQNQKRSFHEMTDKSGGDEDRSERNVVKQSEGDDDDEHKEAEAKEAAKVCVSATTVTRSSSSSPTTKRSKQQHPVSNPTTTVAETMEPVVVVGAMETIPPTTIDRQGPLSPPRMFHPFQFAFPLVIDRSMQRQLQSFQRHLAELMLDSPPLVMCSHLPASASYSPTIVRSGSAFVPWHVCHALPTNRYQELESMVSSISRSNELTEVVFPFWCMLIQSGEMRCILALVRVLTSMASSTSPTSRVRVSKFFSRHPVANEQLMDILLVQDCFRPPVMQRTRIVAGAKKSGDLLPILAEDQPLSFLVKALQVYRSMHSAPTDVGCLHRAQFTDMYGCNMFEWRHTPTIRKVIRSLGSTNADSVQKFVSTKPRLIVLWLEVARLAQWQTQDASWHAFLGQLVEAIRHLSMLITELNEPPSASTRALHRAFQEQSDLLQSICSDTSPVATVVWSSSQHRQLVCLLATFCKDTAHRLCQVEGPWAFSWSTLRVSLVEPCASLMEDAARALAVLTSDAPPVDAAAAAASSGACSFPARQCEYEQHGTIVNVQQWTQKLWKTIHLPVHNPHQLQESFVMPPPACLVTRTATATTALAESIRDPFQFVGSDDDDDNVANDQMQVATTTTTATTTTLAAAAKQSVFPLKDSFKTQSTLTEWMACEALQTALRYLHAFTVQQDDAVLMVAELQKSKDATTRCLTTMDRWLMASQQALLGYLRFVDVTEGQFRRMSAEEAEQMLKYLIHAIKPLWIPVRLFVLSAMYQVTQIWKKKASSSCSHSGAMSVVVDGTIARWLGQWNGTMQRCSFLVNCLMRPKLFEATQSTDEVGSMQSLASGLQELDVLWPELLEEKCWGCLRLTSFKVQHTTTTSGSLVARTPLQPHPPSSSSSSTPLTLNITIDRNAVVTSVLTAAAVKLAALTPGQTRVLKFGFKEETGTGDGVNLEGVRLATQALYDQGLAWKWLEETEQAGIVWPCPEKPTAMNEEKEEEVPSVDRASFFVVLGALQAECMFLGVRLPWTMVPSYLLALTPQEQQLSTTSNNASSSSAVATRPTMNDRSDSVETLLAILKRYDAGYATLLEKLLPMSAKELEAQQVDEVTLPEMVRPYIRSQVNKKLLGDANYLRGVATAYLMSRLTTQPWFRVQTEASLERTLTEPADTRLFFQRLSVADGRELLLYAGCTRTTTPVQWFWEIVLSWTAEQEMLRRQLMVFWTARTSRLANDPPMRIQLEAAVIPNCDARYPTSHTCMHDIVFPRYTSKAIFAERLLFAIRPENTRGFGLL